MTGIKPRTSRVVIYQGDDLARLTELDEAVTKAERRLLDTNAEYDIAKRLLERHQRTEGPALLSDDESDADVRLAAAVEAQRDAQEARDTAMAARDDFASGAEESGVVFVLKSVHRKRWRRLMREHGPRDDNKDDGVFGVNMETLPDALLSKWMPHSEKGADDIAGSIDVDESSIQGESLDDVLESLSDYDYYDRLFVAAFALNRGSATADPTQRLLSASSQTSAATSS